MARLDRPLFSDEARGTVAQTLTFRRGSVHPVALGVPFPHVNWTPSRLAQAARWRFFCDQWHSLTDSVQGIWSDFAPGSWTGFNYFMYYSFAGFDCSNGFGWSPSTSSWLPLAADPRGRLKVMC